jgi:hypothetical protein
MKKIIALVALSLMVAGQAFAADNVGLNLDTNGKSLYGEKIGATAAATSPLIGKTSTGVALGAKTGPQGYAMVTQHKSGSRSFGTAFNSTSVFYIDVTVGTTNSTNAITTPSATDSSIFGAWTSM